MTRNTLPAPPAGWHLCAGNYYADADRKWRIYRRPMGPRGVYEHELWREADRPQEGGPAKARMLHLGSLEACVEFAAHA